MIDTMIGIDLAKNVFQLHGASLTGELKFRKKLSRPQFRKFMEGQPSSIVVFEACGGAHYWARELEGQGHQAKLIAPQYVKPFVKRQKNDAADAEAIVIAAQRPEMRFVEAKGNEQIARGVVFRARDRLVRQRTEQINALRSVLYEQGQVFPKGTYQMKKIAEFLEQTDNGLLTLIREECEELLASISDLTTKIDVKTLKLKNLSKQSEVSRRLQTIPLLAHASMRCQAAGRWPPHRHGNRSLRPTNGHFSKRKRLRRLAGAGAKTTFIRRQGTARQDLQGRPGRHSPPAYHWRNDTHCMGGPKAP